jgi:hypothetical protein
MGIEKQSQGGLLFTKNSRRATAAQQIKQENGRTGEGEYLFCFQKEQILPFSPSPVLLFYLLGA